MIKQTVKELVDLALQVFKVGEQMKLEEAIKQLKQTAQQCHNSKECWDNEFCSDCYMEIEDVFAIETVLQELEHLQEENKELRRKLCIL